MLADGRGPLVHLGVGVHGQVLEQITFKAGHRVPFGGTLLTQPGEHGAHPHPADYPPGLKLVCLLVQRN